MSIKVNKLKMDSCATSVPEFLDPVFAKKSPKRFFSLIENERFRLVFAKTVSINSALDVSRLQEPAPQYSTEYI
jgi:hypothetical protein